MSRVHILPALVLAILLPLTVAPAFAGERKAVDVTKEFKTGQCVSDDDSYPVSGKVRGPRAPLPYGRGSVERLRRVRAMAAGKSDGGG